MKTFIIHQHTRTNHWIEYQMPWSKRTHNIGTIRFEQLHDSITDIRYQFIQYIAASLGEIAVCSKDEMVSNSCTAVYNYLINRLSGRGRQIDFYTQCGEIIKLHNHIKNALTDSTNIEWFDSIHQLCIRFQLNWKDHYVNPLPIAIPAMAA